MMTVTRKNIMEIIGDENQNHWSRYWKNKSNVYLIQLSCHLIYLLYLQLWFTLRHGRWSFIPTRHFHCHFVLPKISWFCQWDSNIRQCFWFHDTTAFVTFLVAKLWFKVRFDILLIICLDGDFWRSQWPLVKRAQYIQKFEYIYEHFHYTGCAAWSSALINCR